MDLADLELNVTHNHLLDLDVGVGQIHLQLCITGTTNQQSTSANGHVMGSQPLQEDTNWEQIIKKYVSVVLWCFVVMFLTTTSLHLSLYEDGRAPTFLSFSPFHASCHFVTIVSTVIRINLFE